MRTYIGIVAAALALLSLTAASWALYDRFSAGNIRLHDQRIFNQRINHATDKLTCALVTIIGSQISEINNPKSQTRQLYVSLGFRPEQIAQIVDQANFTFDKELQLLPQHAYCTS